MHNSWSEGIDEPMSLEAFHTYAKQTLKRLEELESSLQSAYLLFSEEAAFNAEECQCILYLLQITGEPIQDLDKLLENTARLPKAIVLLRYPLEVSLSYMDKQMHELRLHLAQYSSSNRSAAKKVELLEAMRCNFEGILQTHQDILQRIPVLLDQSYFRGYTRTKRRKPRLANSKVVLQFPAKMH
jgi:hypothetical protein